MSGKEASDIKWRRRVGQRWTVVAAETTTTQQQTDRAKKRNFEIKQRRQTFRMMLLFHTDASAHLSHAK
jgi:hypothetical protein